MEKYAFISRHKATESQHQLAGKQGIDLVEIGDRDAFFVSPSEVDEAGAFSGVIVVHPAAALRLAGAFLIGVYKNINRAPVGETPRFEAESLHVYDMRD